MKWEEITEKMNGQFPTQRQPEELILHYLQMPYRNLDSLKNHYEEEQEPLKAVEIMERLALQEPHIYSDFSNALTFHLVLLRKMLER